jgi:hypothetical protein
MGNYYTEGSFLIPCRVDQSQSALFAIRQIDGCLTDYAKDILSREEGSNFSIEASILRDCFFNHPEYDPKYPYEELTWGFQSQVHPQGIHVFTDENLNAEEASVFTQSILKTFRSTALVEIQTAFTADKPYIDGFGGSCCAVSKDSIRWHGLYDFLNFERMAHCNKESYFLFEVNETYGCYKYPSHLLITSSSGTDVSVTVDEFVKNYKGSGKFDDDIEDFWFDGLITTALDNLKEITPSEFGVMKNYLKVISL